MDHLNRNYLITSGNDELDKHRNGLPLPTIVWNPDIQT